MYNPDDVATNLAWRSNNLAKSFVNQETPHLPEFPGHADEAFRALILLKSRGIVDVDELVDENTYRLLPPADIWGYRYVVEYDPSLRSNRYYRVPYAEEGVYITDRNQWTELTSQLIDETGNPGMAGYEIIAFMSQHNAPAIGNIPLTGNMGLAAWFDENINIASATLGWMDAEIPELSPAARPSHSFQFHHSSAITWGFWEYVKDITGMKSTY
jgi:hypothetical protein